MKLGMTHQLSVAMCLKYWVTELVLFNVSLYFVYFDKLLFTLESINIGLSLAVIFKFLGRLENDKPAAAKCHVRQFWQAKINGLPTCLT